jgi:hypothetical protein
MTSAFFGIEISTVHFCPRNDAFVSKFIRGSMRVFYLLEFQPLVFPRMNSSGKGDEQKEVPICSEFGLPGED